MPADDSLDLDLLDLAITTRVLASSIEEEDIRVRLYEIAETLRGMAESSPGSVVGASFTGH